MIVSELAELKPILTSLVLPPAGPLLLLALGAWWARQGRRIGRWLLCLSLLSLWLLSCNAVAVWLGQKLVPSPPALPPSQVAATLKAQNIQAIVILGGGLQPVAPEYGSAQASADAATRIRYAAWLVRQSHLPLAFAGGVGWANHGAKDAPTEGYVTRQMLSQDYGLPLRWVDDQSRDTAENAANIKALMARDGIQRIALVTSAWHMPRALQMFQKAGFAVLPAPTNFATATQRPLLEWLPSTGGLQASQRVLREWLALKITQARGG
ncbi:YdcF family protein [Variovorax sp. HJSM1_2]|uniref:YdcF family protein n=1 Tax=Variovorax sp. HJSM1_2 TaxID=3366263 RepID=UPI003BDD2E96